MTIEESKYYVKRNLDGMMENPRLILDPKYIEAERMAIASLEAWENVRQEIIKQNAKVPTLQNEYLNGLKTAYAHTLAIIDEHLQEVTT